MLKINKDFNAKVISLLVTMLLVFNNAAYGIDLPRNTPPDKLRVPVGDIDRIKKVLDIQLGKYHEPNKYITYDYETGRFTLHLFSDFEETITPSYEQQKLTMDKIVAESIQSLDEKERFEEAFQLARKRVVEAPSEDSYRDFYRVYAGLLTKEHCRRLCESWEFNENFISALERIKELLGIDSIEITIVGRGFTQPFQMFFEKPDIKKKLEMMSVKVTMLITNTLIFDGDVFTGEIRETPLIVEKSNFIPEDALFLGDARDKGYGLKYFVDVNAGTEALDKVLKQLPTNAESFIALQDIVTRRRAIQRSSL